MKASSLVVIALTLLNTIECSGNGGKKGGKKTIKKVGEKAAPTASTSANEILQAVAAQTSPSATPVHALLGNLIEKYKVGNQTILASNKPIDDDVESLKSLSDNEEPVGEKRKRASSPGSLKGDDFADEKEIEADEKRQRSTEDAVDALLSLSNASTAGFDSQKNKKKRVTSSAPKAKKIPAVKEPKQLLPMTDEIFFNAGARNFSRYFDETNIVTVGGSFLKRCFAESHFLALAKFLILNGVKFSLDDEFTISYLQSINAYDQSTENSQKILSEYLKVDPVEATKLFVTAANGAESGNDSVDMLMFGLLVNNDEIGAMFISNPNIPQIVKLLIESGCMPTTLNYILSQEVVTMPVLVAGLEQKDAALVAATLSESLAQKKIELGGKILSIFCHLFGRFNFEFIAEMMNTHRYPLTFTHDENNNPEGDILVAALMAKDLEAFRSLLNLGASYNCKINTKNGSAVSLETFLSLKSSFSAFYEALLAFKQQQADSNSA